MSSSPQTGGWKSALLRHESILLLVVAAEWFYFNSVGRNFGSLDNSYDILRHSVEIGLLALVMTPIILTGGIDLSVGSLLGLCAIVFGKLLRDAGLPIPVAAGGTLLIGALAGRLKHGIAHKEAGLDFIICQGSEGGGHAGEVTSVILWPQMVDAVAPLPVLAAGGIGNGRQMLAAMSMGVQGVWMGSMWSVLVYIILISKTVGRSKKQKLMDEGHHMR